MEGSDSEAVNPRSLFALNLLDLSLRDVPMCAR